MPFSPKCILNAHRKFAISLRLIFFRGAIENKVPLRPQFFGNISRRGIAQMGIVGVSARVAPSV